MSVFYSPRMEELQSRNDDLKERVAELKQQQEELRLQLEEERKNVKHAKEEKVREIKLAREQEQAKADEEREELKQKLQRQMQTELMTKVDSAHREWENQMASLRKTHKQEMDDQIQKYDNNKRQLEENLQVAEEKFKGDLLTHNKKEADRWVREAFKLEEQLTVSHTNIENLKLENKKLRADLQKEISNHEKDAGRSDKQSKQDHQKQVDELKEKNRQLTEKDKHLSELRRKCTTLEIAKEKAEIDLQLARKLGSHAPPTMGVADIDLEGVAAANTIPTKSQREEELLITNSELGALIKRMRNELQQLKKDKAVVDGKLQTALGVADPLKERRKEDMKTILDLNHSLDSREKHLKKLTDERNELKAERDKYKKELETEHANVLKYKGSDKRDMEVAKLKRTLEAKNKEMDELRDSNAKLKTDLHKLKESTDQNRREKAELRMKQLSSPGPNSPAVDRKVREHRRLVELEQTMKETTDKLSESQRSKARTNQRMEDMNESLRRRDKRLKQLADENHKLKSSNQLLEEARERNHRDTVEEWNKTRSELDRAHAQVNRLQQDNMNLRDELLQYTSTLPSPVTLGYTHTRRSRSPSPRGRSHSPRHQSLEAPSRSRSRRHPPTRFLETPPRARSLSPYGMYRTPPRHTSSPPTPSLRPPSSKNQSTNQMKIPIATRYAKNTPTHKYPSVTPSRDHTHSPSPILEDQHSLTTPTFWGDHAYPGRTSSPQATPLSPLNPSPHLVTVTIPQVAMETISPLNLSMADYQDDEFGSQISLESLKDRLELCEFEKEESKIQQDEYMEEFGRLRRRYNVLTEKYNSLLSRSKELSSNLELVHKERLEMDKEVARLHQTEGGEFDVKREHNLREKLNSTIAMKKELEATIAKLIEEKEESEREGGEDERTDPFRSGEQLAQLREQIEQLENRSEEAESLLEEKESILHNKETQMVRLERMLAEKEGELEGERAVVTSLQQQKNEDMVNNHRMSLPRQRRLSREPLLVTDCIQSAQNLAKQLEQEINPNMPDDQLLEMKKLAEYVQQVLEEAKNRLTTPTATPTTDYYETVDFLTSNPSYELTRPSSEWTPLASNPSYGVTRPSNEGTPLASSLSNEETPLNPSNERTPLASSPSYGVTRPSNEGTPLTSSLLNEETPLNPSNEGTPLASNSSYGVTHPSNEGTPLTSSLLNEETPLNQSNEGTPLASNSSYGVTRPSNEGTPLTSSLLNEETPLNQSNERTPLASSPSYGVTRPSNEGTPLTSSLSNEETPLNQSNEGIPLASNPSYGVTCPSNKGTPLTNPSYGVTRPLSNSDPVYELIRPLNDPLKDETTTHPHYEQVRPHYEQVRPHYEDTRPPNEDTRPPNGHTRPPNEDTRPLNGHTRPPNEDTRPPNTEMQQRVNEYETTIATLLEKISQLESRLHPLLANKQKREEKTDHISTLVTTHDKAVGGEREEEGEGEKYPRASNEDDKTALLHRIQELQAQLAEANHEKSSLESSVEQLCEELKSMQMKQQDMMSHTQSPSSDQKEEWFKQWMSQFNSEKKSLKKRIQELETRLGEGSQRVNDLQSLVTALEVEGRVEVGGPDHTSKDLQIETLTDQLSQLKEQLQMTKSPAYIMTTPPTSLGLEVTRSFQHVQYSVGTGNLSQARHKLQLLDSSISELMKAVYPQGLVGSGIEAPQKHSSFIGTSPLVSEIPLQATPTTPSQVPPIHSSSVSPITISSSEAELNEVYTQTTGGVHKATPKGMAGDSTRPSRGTRLFVTLLDYNPLSLCSTGHPERELALHTGDVIAVTGEMDSDGFYMGIFEGRKGLVPSKFLEEMEVADKEAQQRLLNQSLSYSLSPSRHGSERDVSSTPSVIRTTPMSLERTRNKPFGPRPSPPTQASVETSGDCLLVTWNRPALDNSGRSNGYHVIGYTIKCDGIIHKGVGETNPYTKQALLEEVDPNESHVIGICTQSKEGVASVDIEITYQCLADISRSIQPGIRSSKRSMDSVDSDMSKSKLMVAVCDYTPSIDSPNPQPYLELPFSKGKIITVYGNMREDGFYHGELGGVFGLVPSTFVEDFDEYADTRLPRIAMTTNPAHANTPPIERNEIVKRKLFEN